jgi:iron complex transport system substrate-binding protein
MIMKSFDRYPARKAGFLLCLVLAVTLMLGACAAPASVPSTEAPALPTAAPTATQPADTPEASLYPQTYDDVLGRSITIDAQPERIVSLAPSVTEILYAIGVGPQMAGRTDYCNYPPEVEAVPSVGGFDASSISVESIVALEPDLVIGGSIYQADLAKALEDADVKVIVVEPENVADILATIQTLGTITGHAGEAKAVVSDMQTRIDAVTEKVASLPNGERPRVFYEVWNEPLMTASNHTFIGELITMAGGDNIFGDLDEAYPTVSAEEIIERNPDVILGPSNHSDQLTAEMIAARPGWSDLTAVKNGAVSIVDGDIISRAGPRIADALEAIAAALHPELLNG